jgi:hypothetical protein
MRSRGVFRGYSLTPWLGWEDSNSQMSLSHGAICIGLFPASAKSLWYEMFWKTK